MSKTKFNFISLIIVAVLSLTLISIVMLNVTYAQQEDVLDMEKIAPQSEIKLSSLSRYDSVILTKEAVLNNISVIQEYTDNGGEVIIPDRSAGNNLGWSVTEVREGNPVMQPLVAYMADSATLDKSQFDYSTLASGPARVAISDRSAFSDPSTDYMASTVRAYIFANNKDYHIATLTMRVAVDMYWSDYNDIDYYLIQAEATVSPVDKNYRINTFAIDWGVDEQLHMDKVSWKSNHEAPVNTLSFEFESGIKDASFSATTKYTYKTSYPTASISIKDSPSVYRDKSWIYDRYTCVPNGGAQYGQNYTMALIGIYRVNSSIDDNSSIHIILRDIDITGKLTKPNYEGSNTDAIVFFCNWEKELTQKAMMVGNGFIHDRGGDKSDDYLGNFSSTCTLPYQYKQDYYTIYGE